MLFSARNVGACQYIEGVLESRLRGSCFQAPALRARRAALEVRELETELAPLGLTPFPPSLRVPSPPESLPSSESSFLKVLRPPLLILPRLASSAALCI